MPLSQSPADVIGIKTERVANRNEREDLIRFVAKNPFPGFIKKNLLFLVLRKDVVLKTPNSVVQHRQQQSLFRFQRNFSAKILAELVGQQHVGLKKGRDSFVAARAYLHGYILSSLFFEFHVFLSPHQSIGVAPHRQVRLALLLRTKPYLWSRPLVYLIR